MDRDRLSLWSLGLTDEEFPRALAALGALAAMGPRRLGAAWSGEGWRADALPGLISEATERVSGVLRWTLAPVTAQGAMPRLRIALDDAGGTVTVEAPDARSMARTWRAFVEAIGRTGPSDSLRPRLALRATEVSLPRVMAYARLLARPEVGARGVFLAEAFGADGRIDWRWPFTIATLPGDPLEEPLLQRQAALPPGAWPFRYRMARREAARSELLVIGAGFEQALARVLDTGLRLSCCLVVVAGPVAGAPVDVLPLLRALVSRVSAEGVAILDPGESSGWKLSPKPCRTTGRSTWRSLTHSRRACC